MQPRVYLSAQVLSDKVLLLQSAAYTPPPTVRPQYRSKVLNPTSEYATRQRLLRAWLGMSVCVHACVRACVRLCSFVCYRVYVCA